MLPANSRRSTQTVHYSHQHSLRVICVACCNFVTCKNRPVFFVFFPLSFVLASLFAAVFIAKKREVVTLLFLLCLPCDKAMCSWDGLFLYFFKCRGAFKELSAVVRFTALNFCLLVCFGSHILELSWGVAHGIYVQANVRIYVDWWSSQAKYQITHKLGCTLFCGDMTWPLNSLQGILPLKPKYEKRSFRMKWMTINVDTRVECFEHETLCHSSMHALSVMS